MRIEEKERLRQKRHRRLRYKVTGTAERPRLNVSRSIQHIYAQLIDDTTGHTIVAASTLDGGLRGKVKTGGNVAAAKEVGRMIAERGKEKGIDSVVFDRGGYKYHGRVQALADSAREAGLKF